MEHLVEFDELHAGHAAAMMFLQHLLDSFLTALLLLLLLILQRLLPPRWNETVGLLHMKVGILLKQPVDRDLHALWLTTHQATL